MSAPCIKDLSEACFQGCSPLMGFVDTPTQRPSGSEAAMFRREFGLSIATSLFPYTYFTDHESLPSLPEAYYSLVKAFPQYPETEQADQIRAEEYHHLAKANHVCLDYTGHGLFSYSQQSGQVPVTSLPSSSSYPPSQISSGASETSFFEISYKTVNLGLQVMYGGQESEFESKIRKRIMAFMNISDNDYSMFFTANQSSAFKILADSYPFQSNKNLLTVYDHENEAVELLIESSKKRGARVKPAEFSYPKLRIRTEKLRKMIVEKRKNQKPGLFVFPLQSRVSGARYSYSWMGMAQEEGWHVLLDACALGPKDMETLGLSLFKPDFLICSFYRVFGENPSGFACLFVKKSSASVLRDERNPIPHIGIVSLVPAGKSSIEKEESGELLMQKDPSNEISEVETPFDSARSEIIVADVDTGPEIEFRGLDVADKLGIISINNRARYLINWLVNALLSLQHPHSENALPLVRIYGPKVKFEHAPAIAFNVFDWKGERVEPALVQKLADRNNISLSNGFLQNLWFSAKDEEQKKSLEARESIGIKGSKRSEDRYGISVVTAAIGFLTNFDDVYRLWAFVSRFLDADFVEKERWRYTALNQQTIEV